MSGFERQPVTRAVSLALQSMADPMARSDLLFLEEWEIRRTANPGAVLRISQIRRANPDLAAAVARELKTTA